VAEVDVAVAELQTLAFAQPRRGREGDDAGEVGRHPRGERLHLLPGEKDRLAFVVARCLEREQGRINDLPALAGGAEHHLRVAQSELRHPWCSPGKRHDQRLEFARAESLDEPILIGLEMRERCFGDRHARPAGTLLIGGEPLVTNRPERLRRLDVGGAEKRAAVQLVA
jgi:hypothetical protein